MRETNFIRQNKEKWTEFESILKQEKKDPDKLGNLFVQITDDLSYSRTFYPNRYVRVYLNNLAQRIFLSIYKNKKEKRGRFFHFWKEELPLLIHQSRREFLLSFCIFLLSFAIGIFSSIHDHDFARMILGDGYVNMTTENIKSGDPMKVYKESNGMDMFLGITVNNLKIAFMTYIFGILYAVGTIAILLYNGVMVGTFQYFFIERDLFRQSFLTIWMHGTLEISCIIIAGAAGLVLGNGLVFPGTYSRLQSLGLSARRSLKIMTGVAPIIVMAAIIESFFTRFTDVPDALRLAVILISLFFILLYFVWYPIQKSRQLFLPPEIRIAPVKEEQVDLTTIRNNGEIFGDLFIFIRKYLFKFISIAFSLALAGSSILWFVNPEEWRTGIAFSGWSLFDIGSYFNNKLVEVFLVNVIFFALNATLAYYWFVAEMIWKKESAGVQKYSLFGFFIRNFYKAMIVSSAINALFLLPAAITWIIFPFLFPISLLWLFAMVYEHKSPFTAIRKIDGFIRESFLRIYGLFVILAMVSVILYFFIDSPVIWLFAEVLKWNVRLNQETMNHVNIFILRFITLFSIHLLLPLIFTGYGIQYFSLTEIRDASHLSKHADEIGAKNFNP